MKFPPSLNDVLGVIVISLMTILSSAGGIGGAGIMIPYMMLFLRLPIKECLPLANIFGLISAALRFFLNYD